MDVYIRNMNAAQNFQRDKHADGRTRPCIHFQVSAFISENTDVQICIGLSRSREFPVHKCCHIRNFGALVYNDCRQIEAATWINNDIEEKKIYFNEEIISFLKCSDLASFG